MPNFKLSNWARETIWWQVYPLGFLGAEKQALPYDAQAVSQATSVAPRTLRDLEPWLHYLIELGCNGILLGPIFSSESHGYDTIDHFKIDSRLGSDDDFQWFLNQCHSLGIRILLDGVFNHVGRRFSHFQDLKQYKQASAYQSWFLIDWDNKNNEDGFSYKCFEGHHQLVTLNHSNPEVLRYVVDVIKHWLSKGIDGWRLDAAYAVAPEFWHKVIEEISSIFPDAFFLGEVIHGDYANIANRTEIRSITQYELWKAIWSSLNDRNFFELSHAFTRHNQFLTACLPNIFLGNHDVTRIASQLKDFSHLNHAIAILFTIPGIPSIYSGDEQVFRGHKENRAGGDDLIRPAFPNNPASFSESSFSNTGSWDIFAFYKTMARFRRAHQWINQAKIDVITLSNQFMLYSVSLENKSIFVALNISDQVVPVTKQEILAMPLIIGELTNDRHVSAQSCAIWCNDCEGSY